MQSMKKLYIFHLQHELNVDQLWLFLIHGKISLNILPLLDIWNKLFFPNFLNTLPLISTNCWRGENKSAVIWKTNALMPGYICDSMDVFLLTLLDIMMVSRDLLCELKATLRVDAWIMMRMVWKTEQQPVRKITETILTVNTTTLKVNLKPHISWTDQTKRQKPSCGFWY